MTRPDCSSGLVARSRRDPLTRDERVRLDAHVTTCPSCRLEQRIGADFDAIGGVRPGDDVLDARLADAIVQGCSGRAHRRGPPPRWVWASVAAACLLAAAGAGAGLSLGHRRASGPQQGPAQLAGAEGAFGPSLPSPPPAVAEAPAPAVGTIVPMPLVSREAEASAAAPPRVPRPSRAQQLRAEARSEPTEIETASSLFESANGERRKNHVTSAISLYDQLQRRYPKSEEARISRVSLGRLLLERGIWSEALSQLDAYLASGDGGTLVPEALFGRARALEALGQTADARAAWNRLLLTFPDSVYARPARQRLDASH
jgi:TolA-binding protein